MNFKELTDYIRGMEDRPKAGPLEEAFDPRHFDKWHQKWNADYWEKAAKNKDPVDREAAKEYRVEPSVGEKKRGSVKSKAGTKEGDKGSGAIGEQYDLRSPEQKRQAADKMRQWKTDHNRGAEKPVIDNTASQQRLDKDARNQGRSVMRKLKAGEVARQNRVDQAAQDNVRSDIEGREGQKLTRSILKK